MKSETSKNLSRIARGVMRHFAQIGMHSLSEFSPARGLRVDIITLGMSDEIWIVECKSGQSDFKSDKKWQNYLDWCDRYFYLQHKKEIRGIGGIFCDYLYEDWQKNFKFIRELGICFIDISKTMIKRKIFSDWSRKHKENQLIKRGKYVEFNLLYDRGTKFGLNTGGNLDAIFMSLPPKAKWK